jgi:hypothetical protein
VVLILPICAIKLQLLPPERKDNTLKMLTLKKPPKELWRGTLRRDFPIKKPKKELLIMKQVMLLPDGT